MRSYTYLSDHTNKAERVDFHNGMLEATAGFSAMLLLEVKVTNRSPILTMLKNIGMSDTDYARLQASLETGGIKIALELALYDEKWQHNSELYQAWLADELSFTDTLPDIIILSHNHWTNYVGGLEYMQQHHPQIPIFLSCDMGSTISCFDFDDDWQIIAGTERQVELNYCHLLKPGITELTDELVLFTQPCLDKVTNVQWCDDELQQDIIRHDTEYETVIGYAGSKEAAVFATSMHSSIFNAVKSIDNHFAVPVTKYYGASHESAEVLSSVKALCPDIVMYFRDFVLWSEDYLSLEQQGWLHCMAPGDQLLLPTGSYTKPEAEFTLEGKEYDYCVEACIAKSVNLRVKVAYWLQADDDPDGDCVCEGRENYTVVYPVGGACHSWNHYAWQGFDNYGDPIFDIHPNSAGEVKFDGLVLSFRQWTNIGCDSEIRPEGTMKDIGFSCEHRDIPAELSGRIVDIQMPNLFQQGWTRDQGLLNVIGDYPSVCIDNNGFFVVFYCSEDKQSYCSMVGHFCHGQVTMGQGQNWSQAQQSVVAAVNDNGLVFSVNHNQDGRLICYVSQLVSNELTLTEPKQVYELADVNYDSASIALRNDGAVALLYQTNEQFVLRVGQLNDASDEVSFGQAQVLPVDAQLSDAQIDIDSSDNFVIIARDISTGSDNVQMLLITGKLNFADGEPIASWQQQNLFDKSSDHQNRPYVSINNCGHMCISLESDDVADAKIYTGRWTEKGIDYNEIRAKSTASDPLAGKNLRVALNNNGDLAGVYCCGEKTQLVFAQVNC